jgi:hypothetical protein
LLLLGRCKQLGTSENAELRNFREFDFYSTLR